MNNNQIDLSSIYGLNNDCKSQESYNAKNYLTAQNIPSLEQIAAYNLASRGIAVPTTASVEETTSTFAENAMDFPTGAYDSTFEQINSEMTADAGKSAQSMQEMARSSSITDFSNPYPVTSESIQYLNGFIRTQIGRRVKISFLVGSNTIEEKDGYLLGVGANYILLNELDTNDLTACDFYNVKFMRFYY